MKNIDLKVMDDMWCARFEDDPQWWPTPYKSVCSFDEVADAIEERNPGCFITEIA